MVVLERQDQDLCRRFAEKATRVALSESRRGERDRSDRSDRYDDHTHLRVKTVRLWVREAVTFPLVGVKGPRSRHFSDDRCYD